MTIRQYFIHPIKTWLMKQMSTLTRKQRNFLEREQELINLALKIMHEDGFTGLSMDKLTARSDYSKGTIYNHFSCKEDVLSAIGITCLVELDSLFSRAMTFQGNTRERLIAVHYAYMLNARLNPEQFMCVLSCKTSSVAEKASEKHQLVSINKERKLLELLNGLVRDAETMGDLTLLNSGSGSDNVDAVTFSIWSMSFGTLALLMRAAEAQIIKKLDTQAALLNNINITLDGLGWQPLCSKWNYSDTIKRIQTEIFAPEMALLQQQSQ